MNYLPNIKLLKTNISFCHRHTSMQGSKKTRDNQDTCF
jgi:hypothetical protein